MPLVWWRCNMCANVRTDRYIGKCKACGGIYTSGLGIGESVHRYQDDPKREGDVYTHRAGSLVLDCRLCGRPCYAHLVRGKYNPTVECNGKCMGAHGTTCECSCGGKNHGKGFAA
jgi:hypothetical protein